MQWGMLAAFVGVFMVMTIMGLLAARWRPGDLNRLQEWALAGRRFGPVVSWFLIGGDLYTAYTFMAVPALVYAQGAQGFFASPYLTLAFVFALIMMPRFWVIARHRGYVTQADFVRERFGSSTLALIVAVTGIMATMPYIAIQIYGIQVCIAQMGINVELALFIAFLILALYTYVSGLRGPALIAIFKDLSIWLVAIASFVIISLRLGGLPRIFAAVPADKLTLSPTQYSTFSTLILGSAMALFLYPHAFTAMLSANSRRTLKRTLPFLLAYTFLQSLIGLFGFMAIAAGIKPSPLYKTNSALPALFASMLPPWLAGFAFAAISIGALVPAGVMSIAAANLFTRNIYREYFHPNCTEREESAVAKTASLVIKFGALLFILFFPTDFAINLQLFANVWIIQILPAVLLGLYTRWFHHLALICGWAGGMVLGTWMVLTQNFGTVYSLALGGLSFHVYAAFAGLVLNLVLCCALTPLFDLLGLPRGQDNTSPTDYAIRPVTGFSEERLLQQASQLRQTSPAGAFPLQDERVANR
ncbi:sodium:solute symporter family protein [Thermogemmatispora carboxidivorans]|uniref:sodium:solute symporter family protein n=1 Tax=Thermogemmatispora carboxidivorans TaxID=1382306 RepID=UPI003B51503B